jgi:hypothetical protein
LRERNDLVALGINALQQAVYGRRHGISLSLAPEHSVSLKAQRL